MGKKNDIQPGNRYNAWTVLSCAGAPKPGAHIRWVCRCDCGTVAEVNSNNLRSGISSKCKACGLRAAQESTVTHGNTRGRRPSASYISWSNMLDRCTNPNTAAFPDYGGRGITVCVEWRSFETFLRDMGERPPGYTIDRIDVNLGYSKSNCRWVPRAEQNRNTRVNRYVVIDGTRYCLAEAARVLGVPAHWLYQAKDPQAACAGLRARPE